MNKQKGFTLIEMLVVIAILSVAGMLILTAFTRTLRGSSRSQLLGVIKQNGQSVLENMDKTIRNSDNVVCISPAPSTTLTIVKNGVFTRYRFFDPTLTDNGYIQQDNPAKQIVAGSSPHREETDGEFTNRACNPADPMPNATILTDTNTTSGVSVENAFFEKTKTAGFRDSVLIKFDVKVGKGIPQSLAADLGVVPFQTTINLR